MAKLESDVYNDLETELQITEDSDLDILTFKIKNAIREVKKERNYQPHHTEKFIEKDLENYYSNIHDLALYDFSQVGGEGQLSHSENGTSRTWKDRKECLKGIIPFCSIF